jgi:uncharacterized phage protein gp47/JayE
MSFSNRTWDETVAMLLTAFASMGTDVTDLREGSVITTILESVAVVSQQIEEDLASRLDADIATSAYRSFDFSLRPEQAATGSVQVFPTDLTHPLMTIPVGTSFVVPGTNLRYISTQEVVLGENISSITIPVTADVAGTISNVPAGSVTRLETGISGIAACNNPYPFVNGKDAETEVERRIRFQHWIAKLHYGTTNAIEAGISEVRTNDTFGVSQERVGRVRVDEGESSLVVYITDDTVLGSNSSNYPLAASNELIQAVQDTLQGKTENGIKTAGFKAAGVKATTFAATIHPVPINLFVKPVTGYSMSLLAPSLQENIQRYFNRLNIGESLSLQDLKRTIITTRGVQDFVLGLPTINVAAETNEILTLIPFSDVSSNPPIALDTSISWIQRF